MYSVTGSQIINAFTQVNHHLKIKAQNLKTKEMMATVKNRRGLLKDSYTQVGFQEALRNAQRSGQDRFHLMDFQELQSYLKTDLQKGISDQQAQLKLKQFGFNKLSQKPRVPWFIKLILQFTAPFNILLQIGGILALLTWILDRTDPSGLYLFVVLWILTILTAFFSFYQNNKVQNLLDSFKNLDVPQVPVLRQGEQKKINSQLIVPGDVIRINLGDRIPADIRVIENSGMKVDNSPLNGQTKLLSRTINSEQSNPFQAKNLAFKSTMCGEGSCRGVVFATGDRTVIGQIAQLARQAQAGETNLSKQISRYILIVLVFAMTLGVIFFGLGFAIGYPLVTNLIFCVGIALGTVPQGLLMQITIMLMISAQRLAKRKILVKQLQSIQTLGSTSCICSDKTGTLTMNKMACSHLFYGRKSRRAQSKQKYGSKHLYQYDQQDPTFRLLQICAVCSSDAVFDKQIPKSRLQVIQNNQNIDDQEKKLRIQKLIGDWAVEVQLLPYAMLQTIGGNASQHALIKFFHAVQPIQTTRNKFNVITDLNGNPAKKPFDSFTKTSHSFIKFQKSIYMIVKGAPQRVWDKCKDVMVEGKFCQKSQKDDQDFNEINNSYGSEGERILGFAYKDMGQNFRPNMDQVNYSINDLIFLGLISMTDPPRDTVPKAVLKCQAAGIKVIMVTGDQPTTALAIARQCNIITKKTVNQIAYQKKISFQEAFGLSDSIVIHGDMLTQASREDEGLPASEQGKKLSKWLQKKQIVFARTSPAQKLIIVKGNQDKNNVVAVTGDGVNDSPAIKRADIGISMGITGTEVAKDAADMILLNDDFSSIVTGIQQGRVIFDNLKKVVAYTMASNVPQTMPFLFFVILKFPLPLTAILIMSIDIGTDFLPAISISWEPGQLDLMTRRPKRLNQHLVTAKLVANAFGQIGMIGTWACLFGYFVVMQDYGYDFFTLFGKASINVVVPNKWDEYNPKDPYFGNSVIRNYVIANNSCPDSSFNITLDWLTINHGWFDLRLGAVVCNKQNLQLTQLFTKWQKCTYNQISPVTNRPVCYTTDALKYANTCCFFSIVVYQIMNLWSMKTRTQSIMFHGSQNPYTYWGYFQQIGVMVLLAYCVPLNTIFGTRDVQFLHSGITALPFGLLFWTIQEMRKMLIRNLPNRDEGRMNIVKELTYW